MLDSSPCIKSDFLYILHIWVAVGHFGSQSALAYCIDLALRNECSEAVLSLVYPWVIVIVAENTKII